MRTNEHSTMEKPEGPATPGPWQFTNGYIAGVGENNATIAKVTDHTGWKADGLLLAAAPKMLEALKETLRQLNAPDCPAIPDGAMVRGRILNAIAKAQGEE